MSEQNQINVNYLHSIVLQEYENTSIQKIDLTLYNSVSKLIGNLKSQEYDGHEAKIKTALISMLTELTSSLLKTRLEKAILNNTDHSALLDEEKYILNSLSPQSLWPATNRCP